MNPAGQEKPAGQGIFVDGFGQENPPGHSPAADEPAPQYVVGLQVVGEMAPGGQKLPSGQPWPAVEPEGQ